MYSFYTLTKIDSTKENRSRGIKTMDIKVRTVYGFRSIGVGHTLLTSLCRFLNMPPQMTRNAYDDVFYSIKVACKQVREKSMSNTAAILRGTEPTADVGVSVVSFL